MPITVYRPRDDDADLMPESKPQTIIDLAGIYRRYTEKRFSVEKLEGLMMEASQRLRESEDALRDYNFHKALKEGKLPRGPKFREAWR